MQSINILWLSQVDDYETFLRYDEVISRRTRACKIRPHEKMSLTSLVSILASYGATV